MTANAISIPLNRQTRTTTRHLSLVDTEYINQFNTQRNHDYLIKAILEDKSLELKNRGISSTISELDDEFVLEWYQSGARCAFSVWPEDSDGLYVSHKNGECIERIYFDNFLNFFKG